MSPPPRTPPPDQADLRRLIAPTLAVLFFSAVVSLQEDILLQMGSEALTQGRMAVHYGVQVGLWLSAAFFVNRLIEIFFWDGLVGRAFPGGVPRLLKDVSAVVVAYVAFTGIVGFVFHRPLTGIWATSSAAGVVLGFALKNIILDVFIGLATNIDRPYAKGDWILIHGRDPSEAESLEGRVLEINWRTTRIETRDGNVVMLPNSAIGESTVTNLMLPSPRSRRVMRFELDHALGIDRARRVLEAAVGAATRSPLLLDEPAPEVLPAEPTEAGRLLLVRYWVDMNEVDPIESDAEVALQAYRALDAAGIPSVGLRRSVEAPEGLIPLRKAEVPADRAAVLGAQPLLALLAGEELEALAEQVGVVRLDAGETLLRKGDTGTSMFILVEGLLDVLVDLEGDGVETRVGSLSPGDSLGEMSLMTGEPRSATVEASTRCLLFEIAKPEVARLLEARPELAEKLSRQIAARRYATDQARANRSRVEQAAEVETLSQQLLAKMRAFFG